MAVYAVSRRCFYGRQRLLHLGHGLRRDLSPRPVSGCRTGRNAPLSGSGPRPAVGWFRGGFLGRRIHRFRQGVGRTATARAQLGRGGADAQCVVPSIPGAAIAELYPVGSGFGAFGAVAHRVHSPQRAPSLELCRSDCRAVDYLCSGLRHWRGVFAACRVQRH